MSTISNAPIPVLPERFADLTSSLEALARDGVEGIVIAADRTDPTFGTFGPITSFIRSAVSVEGAVLEAGLRTILEHDGGFTLMPVDFKLPIIEAAQAAVRSNEKNALVALRLDPRVYAVEHYTPDLFAVHRESGVGYLLELKRTTGSYGRAVLEQLEQKMLAAGLVARDALLMGRRRLLVSSVEMAIVDCSEDDRRDRVIGLAALDELLECPGVGDSLRHLRARYAHHIQIALKGMVEPDESRRGPQRVATSERQEDVQVSFVDDEGSGANESPVAISFARKCRLATA
ncbi:hypothetical protein GCM10007989_13260 [Devosia pacifica]|uniref:Uncharacterized protein n=1 Tax=Devosia pacifica TaxID=1335967 RepID=A0A918VRW7_9HYPH|nr:hypothetical protein [Devosia pacifica]GHA19129.1 hypothetical protein GCM10007989_13260 [Devosia pacifica]